MNCQDPDGIMEDILRIERFKPVRHIVNNAKKILDVGGGSGRIWNINGVVDKDIILIDIDLSGVEYDNPYSHMVCDDAMRAVAFTEDVDLITITGLLEHLDNPVAFLSTFRGCGVKNIYITVPNAYSFHRQVGLEMGLIDDVHELGPSDYSIGHKRVYDMRMLQDDIKHSLRGSYGIRSITSKGFKFDTSTAMGDMEISKLRAIQSVFDQSFNTNMVGAELCVLLEEMS